MHIIHSFLSVQVGPYATEQRLLAFRVELPSEGLPPIADIPVAFLAVRRAVSAILREDHMVHVEGIPPSYWQTMPCKRARRKENGRDLACRGLTFLPPDAPARLLGAPRNIAEASQLLFPLLAGRVPPQEEALDWLQSGAYVVPGFTDVTFQTPAKGGPLFVPDLQRICTLYPEAYVGVSTSTL